MNPIAIISLGLTFLKLNSGKGRHAKKILKEGTDVLQTLASVLKDKRITGDEKKRVVKELREFSDAAIKAIDAVVIPT